MGSKKTTFAGIALVIGMILVALASLFDGNSATNPEWANLINALKDIGWISAGLAGSLIGLFARDNDKSSEDVGLK